MDEQKDPVVDEQGTSKEQSEEKDQDLQKQEETVDGGQVEDEGEDEEDGGEDDLPHPLDMLADTMSKIDKQVTRLKSRNAGNLKFELQNNVYPLLYDGLQAIYTWIAEYEESLEESEEEVAAEQFHASMREESKQVIDICGKLLADEHTEEDWRTIRGWAQTTRDRLEKTMQNMEEETK